MLRGLIDAHNHLINLDKRNNFTLSAGFQRNHDCHTIMKNMRSRGIEDTTSEMIQRILICRYYDLN